MRPTFFALPILALATTIAAAQTTTSTPQSPETQKPGQTSQSETQNNTAGSISGNASPTNAAPGQTTAPQNSTTPDPTVPTTDRPAAAPQQQQPAGQSPSLPQGSAPAPSSNVADSATLKGQLDQAYQSEPSLSGSTIHVDVTDTAVNLSGSVPTGKEKTTAKRIAQSYAGNRKVVEKLTVTGRGNPSAQPSSPKQ